MNATTETRVPSPEQEAAREAPAPNLPANVAAPSMMIAPPPAGPFGSLVAAIAGVMADLEAVKKGGENTFHHYKYARMQDVLQMLTPLMGKHGVVVFQYEIDRQMFDDGNVLAIRYNFVVAHKSGEQWPPVPQTGMSPCRTSKQSGSKFDDKSFAKCHTSARKYFLLSLFQVPTEDDGDDPDNERGARTQAPVPGADGRVPPHKLEPGKNETFERWSGRYLVLLRTATSTAEVDAWDKANDELLGQMSNDEKGKPFYDRIMGVFTELSERFGGQPETVVRGKPDPISTGPLVPDEAALREMAAEDRRSAPRPANIPDADKDPDAFILWAQKRMDAINDPAELTVIWEGEITPWSDGLFLPDCKALEEHYNARLAKIGG